MLWPEYCISNALCLLRVTSAQFAIAMWDGIRGCDGVGDGDGAGVGDDGGGPCCIGQRIVFLASRP